MLERVISITNVGRFRNSAATPNPAFAKRTMLFAPNGYGKTTLCAILRSLERGDPSFVLGRQTLGSDNQPAISLLWSGGQRQFRNGAWVAREPSLSIFDGTFVVENVHSGEAIELANRRNLYRVIVGRQGVELAAAEVDLTEAGRTVQQALTLAERTMRALAGDMALAAFYELPADPAVQAKLATLRQALAAQNQAAAIRDRDQFALVEGPIVPEDLELVLRRTLDDVDARMETLVAAHLRKHHMVDGGEAWLSEGTRLASSDDCPFCGRDGIDELELVRALRGLFGDAYSQLQQGIDGLRASVDLQFGQHVMAEIRAVAVTNLGHREFWAAHCNVGPDFPALALLREPLADAHRGLGALIDAKKAKPLDTFSSDAQLAELMAVVERIGQDIGRYNAALEAANQAIRQKKAEVALGNSARIEAEINALQIVEHRHTNAGVEACNRWKELFDEKARIVGEKDAVRRQLEAHCERVVRPYQDRINHYLELFNAGFQIVNVGHGYPGGVATSNYALQIDGVGVPLGDGRTANDEPSFKNTLSAGDRTTLALAFFLAELDREQDLSDRVVVFDDPFNSQDAFRRRQTIYEIAAVATRGAQVIVLSHDPVFLKQLWDKSAPADRSALQVMYHPAHGSKLTAFDLADACRGRAAAELDDLLAFRASGAGNLREIIKKLRVVLETHFRSAFTGRFLPADNLGEIIRKIREGGPDHPASAFRDQLDRINDYTADYHHGEDPRGEIEPPIDRDELMAFVKQTLRIANASPA